MHTRAPLLHLLLTIPLGFAERVEVTDRGIASQTTEWNKGPFPAALAVDGDPNTFSHTDSPTANNAWELRFDDEYELTRIDLLMRVDCCGGRLTGSTLRLFDGEGDSVYDASISDPGQGQTLSFTIPANTLAQTIRVGFEDGATNPVDPSRRGRLPRGGCRRRLEGWGPGNRF